MIRILNNLEEILAAVLVVVLCIVVGLEVVLRYVLAQPLSWTEEFSTMVFVWMTMLGSSIALKRGEHFAVELFRPRVSAAARRRLKMLTHLFVAGFCAFLIYYGLLFTVRSRGVQTPALEWPRAIPYAALPVGGAFMLVRSLQMLTRQWRTREAAP